MAAVSEENMRLMRLEIKNEERKNLKTQTKNDGKMVEEISRIINYYTKQRM